VSSTDQDTVFAKIGGETLRAVIRDFYERLFADVMIGFFFRGKDREELIEREWELTARFLGAADIRYRGRPLREAHAPHRILGGQFHRRLQILRDTLRDHQVDPAVQAVWIEHTMALRPQITRESGTECDDDRTAKRK
jgi:hemoglobin